MKKKTFTDGNADLRMKKNIHRRKCRFKNEIKTFTEDMPTVGDNFAKI